MKIPSFLVCLSIILFFNSLTAQKVPNCPERNYSCDTDWQLFTDPNSGVEYGYKAFIQDSINFYEADIFCRDRCAEVVSIHSQQEQDFVTRIAGPLLTKCQFTDACSERMEHTNKSAANFDRMLRGFRADIFCRDRCAEVVSIHSQQEQDFVTRIAGPLLTKCQFTDACSERMEHTNKSAANFDRMLRGFWIGMNRVWGTLLNHNTIDTNITCIWSDRSQCDYGSVLNGSVTPDTVSPPWARGNPNGANPGGDPLIVQACVQMVEGRHGGWNDISCSYRLGGLICKRKCSSYCAAQDA
uniref:C-type lectin domain-containing protein n=1 Tax=Meloidogyne incognita TaxID=6306 RepID=A0A914L871_MELIC